MLIGLQVEEQAVLQAIVITGQKTVQAAQARVAVALLK